MDRISTSMLHCFYDHRLEMPFATYSESHLDSLTCAFTTSERGCGITTNEELRADRVCKRSTLSVSLPVKYAAMSLSSDLFVNPWSTAWAQSQAVSHLGNEY